MPPGCAAEAVLPILFLDHAADFVVHGLRSIRACAEFQRAGDARGPHGMHRVMVSAEWRRRPHSIRLRCWCCMDAACDPALGRAGFPGRRPRRARPKPRRQEGTAVEDDGLEQSDEEFLCQDVPVPVRNHDPVPVL